MATNIDLEQDPKMYQHLLYENTIQNIETAFDAGELDEEEAEGYKIQALNDLNIRLLIEDGYDEEEAVKYVLGAEVLEDEEDEESELVTNYSENDMATAEFSDEYLNDFAIALAELIEDEYETIEDGIYTLAEATGYEPDEIVTLFTGEAVPDETLVDQISSCLDSTQENEDIYIALQLLAAEARGEDVSEEIANEYEDEDEYEINNPELEAAWSEVDALKNRLATFESNQVLKTKLDQLIRKGNALVQEFKMTPSEFNNLFGSVPEALDEEKVAIFTSFCNETQVPIEAELYAMGKVLEAAERSGVILPNGRIVNEEFTAEETQAAEFEAEAEAQAKRNMELLKNKGIFNLEY